MKPSTIMLWTSVLAVVPASATVISCLNGCKCEKDVPDPTIRCDQSNLDYFPLPVAKPYPYYNFLALTCNSINSLPPVDMILRAFPDLHGIDIQGNRLKNCSELEQFRGKLAVLSDCGDAEPLICVQPTANSIPEPDETTSLKEDGREIEDSAEIFIPYLNPVVSKTVCTSNCDNIDKLKNLWVKIEKFSEEFKLNHFLEWIKMTFLHFKRILQSVQH